MNSDQALAKANAVIFLRSRCLTVGGSDPEGEQHDIARQRRDCHDYADQLEATVVREYVEHGGTGPLTSRPVVRRMLTDLQALLGVRYVLVTSLDRLCRRPEDLHELTRKLDALGVHVVALDREAHVCAAGHYAWLPADPTTASEGGLL